MYLRSAWLKPRHLEFIWNFLPVAATWKPAGGAGGATVGCGGGGTGNAAAGAAAGAATGNAVAGAAGCGATTGGGAAGSGIAIQTSAAASLTWKKVAIQNARCILL